MIAGLPVSCGRRYYVDTNRPREPGDKSGHAAPRALPWRSDGMPLPLCLTVNRKWVTPGHRLNA
jgi:hypothetical protein